MQQSTPVPDAEDSRCGSLNTTVTCLALHAWGRGPTAESALIAWAPSVSIERVSSRDTLTLHFVEHVGNLYIFPTGDYEAEVVCDSYDIDIPVETASEIVRLCTSGVTAARRALAEHG